MGTTATGVTFDGSHIWVGNETGGAGDFVKELDATDGSVVRTFSGNPYGFNGTFALAFDGSHIWVVNQNGNSVTQLPAG